MVTKKLSKRAVRNKDGSITIDEGEGYKMMAYRLEHPTNNVISPVFKEAQAKGHKIKAVPTNEIFGNPFTFVVICAEHPNYGYFADAGFFWKSMHCGWESTIVTSWMNKYKINHHIDGETVTGGAEVVKNPLLQVVNTIISKKDYEEPVPNGIKLFLEDYPEFKELFK